MSPAFAAVQNVVDPRTRATAAALFLFCITVPGAIGPVAVGFVSDRVASASMNVDVATYLAMCPGGKAAADIAAATAAQCGQAATTGLRTGMLVGICLYVVSFFVYLLAVRAGRKAQVTGQAAQDGAH